MSERLLILADGELGVFSAKTTTSLLRYRRSDIAAVLDRQHAGRTAREVLGVPADTPIIATLEEGIALGAQTLVIGIAPSGGKLPPAWREIIRRAIQSGLSIVSGLHVFLSEDRELAELARWRGVEITDLRRPPEGQPIAHMEALRTRGARVLTVGTDCNVGKMVAALEIAVAARARGLDARFVATGQTGMLIAGEGLTLDRVPGDFMAGFVEQQVLAESEAELILVEGQGCLLHPAYSGVTLALLHGSLPDAMILVHHAGRSRMRNQPLEIRPLEDWVRRYEDALEPLHPGKVVGIAVNPYGLPPAQAHAAVREAEERTGLPAVDVLDEGPERLLEAILTSLPSD